MLIEGISIALIIGSCAFVVWIAKNKFQPEIERNIEKQKKQENELKAEFKMK